MQSKSLLIAVAAFAVTATGVQAFQGTELLQKAGLTEEQIEAFESAREKREAGDLAGARDVLIEAGVDEEVLASVREAVHEERQTNGKHHSMMMGGRARFLEDLTDEQREALEVARKANDKEAVKAIMEEAGIPFRHQGHHF
jgi:predicted DNA binding protein